jgi:hypothetical protein
MFSMAANEATGMICPTCRDWIDPADPSLIFAYEQKDASGFSADGHREMIDGIPGCFHPSCFPGLPRYRQAPRP